MRALASRVVFVVLAAMFVVGCSSGTGGAPASAGGGGGGGGGGAGELPPVGKVWFGTGFEAGSLTVQGRSDTQKAGQPLVALGNFLAAKPPEEMQVQIVQFGSIKHRIEIPAGEPSRSFGVDISSANLGPGSYLVNFVDTNRRTLASGNLTITQ